VIRQVRRAEDIARLGAARDAELGEDLVQMKADGTWLHQKGEVIQEFGTIKQFPIGLSCEARMYSCQRLNKVLDKRAGERLELVYTIAERVQSLGGVAVGDPRHVADITSIPRPPDGVEQVPAMLSRLLEAHEAILIDAHAAAARTAEPGDDGSNDLLVSQVIRTGELQAWFLAEHLVDTPLVRA
jgi:starvation-inducible DNA-binding protein